ncbi:MAG: LysM peptidoglycan-binding domain-containing protein [Bifidobacterium sp.]|jgi:LysM repeat protein
MESTITRGGVQPVIRSSTSGSRTGRTRLTARGRAVLATLFAVLAMWATLGFVVPQQAQSATGTTQVVNYTVRPGDTLWSYAQSITPAGDDVSVTVRELMKLNNMDTPALRTGQRILVPEQ